MTLDEAIKIYASNAEYERTHGNLQGCLDFRQLAEWLKDYKRLIEQEPQTGWIPVSERLPKKSGDYWCTFGGTNLTGSDYYTTESDAKKIFDDPEEYTGWRAQNVIAWMPLPEPYKAESEG